MITKTWKEVESEVTEDTVAIIPVGSIEQHGLHAPLGTDYFIADNLSKIVKNYENTLLIPPIPIGVADYHRHFSGSLWVKPETFKNYISEIIESMYFHGIKKVIFVNGHGGNREPLREVARHLEMEKDIKTIVWTWFESIEKEITNIFNFRPPFHASEAETSMLLNFTPQFIIKDNYLKSAEGSSNEWGKYYEGTIVSQEVRDFSQSGATGNPVNTDPEKGERMLELAGKNLKKLVDYVSSL